MKKHHETCLTIKDSSVVKRLSDYVDNLYAANLRKWTVAELGKKLYLPQRKDK